MKLSKVLVPSALALWVGYSWAQAPAPQTAPVKEEKGQHIAYEKKVPQLVARLMPRGAKSLFWGTFAPTEGSAPMAIHLFDLQPTEGVVSQRLLGLDVFNLSPRLHKINRVAINFKPMFGESGPLPLFDVQLYWLQKAKTDQPVLKVRCFTKDGFEGAVGDEVVTTFLKGWRGKSSSESWAWGSWSGSDTIGEDNILYYDNKGHLQVKAEVYGANVP